jgi:phosphoribosylformylglycinamidine synthase subunit PurL
MAAKGRVGIDVDVAKVPLRELGMEPYEIMISESQERMLCVVEPDRLGEVLSVCSRWDVCATPIGDVTETGSLRVFEGEELVGDMPVTALVDDCPLYDLDPEEAPGSLYPPPAQALRDDADPREALLALLGSPNVASKRFAFEQYDSIVGSRTVRGPQAADAAVLTLEHDRARGALAVSIDGNGRRVACDPYTGAVETVLECARNLACTGAEPLGATNCLNFGNPEKQAVAWQLTRAVLGMRDALLALHIPVVSGNVSLYNEGGEGPIYPSPIVGMVGKLPHADRVPGAGFTREGHAVALVGPFTPSLAGSELEKLRGALADGLPGVDLDAQARALTVVREAAGSGRLASAHDVSDGGLACALAECCIVGGIGAWVDLSGVPGDPEAALFGEGPGAVVVSGPREMLDAVEGATVLGETGGETLEIRTAAASLSLAVTDAREAYERAIPDRFA